MQVIAHRSMGFALPTDDPKQRGVKRLVISKSTEPVSVPPQFAALPEFQAALNNGALQKHTIPQTAAAASQDAQNTSDEATPEQSASEPVQSDSDAAAEDAKQPAKAKKGR